MWRDIVIGYGPTLCSAVKVFSIDGEHNISHNSVSYWISDVYLGCGMTIYKNTPEGEDLKSMIDSQKPVEQIYEWLSDLVLTRLSTTQLKERIRLLGEHHFELGRQVKAEEMRAVLGI